MVSPSKVFEWIKEKPNWWIPVIVLIITSVITAVISAPLIAEVAQQQILKDADKMPPEALEQMQKMMDSPFAITAAAVSTIVGVIISILIQTGIFHLAASMFGGSAKFTVGLATVAYAQVPVMLQQIIQSIFTAASKKLIVPGLSAVLPPEQAMTPIGTLLGRIDIATIWSVILIVIGFSITYKISKAKAGTIAVGYWTVATILMVAMAAASSAVGTIQ